MSTAPTITRIDVDHTRRLRLSCRAGVAAGLAVSVTANILAAEPTWIGRGVAACPPLALFLAVEIVMTIPKGTKLAKAVTAMTVLVAGVAAWISYWHMVALNISVGERLDSAHLFPLSVDGLVAASTCGLIILSRGSHPSGGSGEPLTKTTPQSARGQSAAPQIVPSTETPSTNPPIGDGNGSLPVSVDGQLSKGWHEGLAMAEKVETLTTVENDNPGASNAELKAILCVGERTIRNWRDARIKASQ